MNTLTLIAHTLDEADAALHDADLPTAQARLNELRALIAAEPMLTTREAATLLGIKSVNTVKALARTGKLPFRQEPGAQMRLPLTGVLHFKAVSAYRHLIASEQIHDETADLGSDTIPPDTREDMIPAPGSLPWQRH